MFTAWNPKVIYLQLIFLSLLMKWESEELNLSLAALKPKVKT